MKIDLKNVNMQLEKQPPEKIIQFIYENFEQPFACATSLSVEDQLLTFYIVRLHKPCFFFTLDTGRLPQDTYDTIEKTEKIFGIKIHLFFPDSNEVQTMVNEHGINLFYKSKELRQLCCKIRKTHPLKKALIGMKGWFSGIRREQSITRISTPIVDWDTTHSIYKFNPLVNLLEREVWELIEKYKIPYNQLQKQGYRSLGCLPCTRPISPDDDFRAGRWWWEEPESRECGIHMHNT
ncbi:MAG: phosphoadenylyl-sulfate reductase [Bacteroidales bacterium]|nr:phosphoadenylyl-sulfate reductase [Bacteroidales bacterium]